jgi:hypothetical protein
MKLLLFSLYFFYIFQTFYVAQKVVIALLSDDLPLLTNTFAYFLPKEEKDFHWATA